MFGLFKKKPVAWPFEDPQNCAVFTLRQIMTGESPIQTVYHDITEGEWQFLSNIDYAMDDAKLVSLEEITKLDPTVFELATMKPGYHAWRSSPREPWIIEKTPEENLSE